MLSTLINGIEIAWERHGNESDPVICLIHGLGMPLSAWPPLFIRGLVQRGYCVITMDNRDIGHSQLMKHHGTPSVIVATLKRKLRLKVRAPYPLTAMMSDTVGLLRSLGIDGAHIVGVSMGGMIAQLVAIHEPGLALSLTSIMSSSGRRGLPGPDPVIARHLLRRPLSRSPQDRLAFSMRTWKLISSPAYPSSDSELEEFITRNMDRGMTAAGIARQTLAIVAAPSRAAQLGRLEVPSLIIHGKEDPLVKVACGEDTARSIPGAKLYVIPGMGHNLPLPLQEHIVGLIADHANNAAGAAAR